MSTRERRLCKACTRMHRGQYDDCWKCRSSHKDHKYPEQEIALTVGQWVRKGSIRVWVGEVPAEHEPQADVLATLARNLAEPTPITGRPEPTFCACGCWLLNADEDCPACMAHTEWLPWATKAETHHNLTTYGRAA